MAQHASALKRARQDKKRNVRKVAYMSKMKTTIKKVRSEKNKEKATELLVKTSKLLDQLASKGVIHKNKAANQKSSLKKYVDKLQ